MRKAWVRVSLLALAVSAPAAAVAADYARTLAYEQTVAGITAMVVAGGSAHDLQAAAAPLGLTLASSRREAPALPQLSEAHVSLVAIDLVLSQLALQAGANYHVALRQAQSRPEVLLLDAGVTSLAALYDAVTAAGLTGVLDKTDDGYVLHVPLAVWNDATLSLQPGETLLIDRASGAFIVAAGTLAGTDAAIRATGAENPRLKDFNPFVVIALSGSAQFDRMRFSDLGYGMFAPLTGVTLVEGGFYRKGTPSHISNSRLRRCRLAGAGRCRGCDGRRQHLPELERPGRAGQWRQGSRHERQRHPRRPGVARHQGHRRRRARSRSSTTSSSAPGSTASSPTPARRTC